MVKQTSLFKKRCVREVKFHYDTFYYFQSKTKLSRIYIRHGDIIDGIQCFYGDTSTEFCGSPSTGKPAEVVLDKNEFITRVYGKHGSWFGAHHILSINIETNKGKHYTFGTASHGYDIADYDLSCDNHFIVGFCASNFEHTSPSGVHYISDIGVYLIPSNMEFVGVLLRRYHELLPKYKKITLGIIYDQQINDTICVIKGICDSKDDKIKAAIEWYMTQETKDENAEFRLLLATLSYIDGVYASYSQLSENITSGGLLCVGKRLFLHNDKIAGYSVFQNLRLTILSDAEFDAYNNTYEIVKESPIYNLGQIKGYPKVSDYTFATSSMSHTYPRFSPTRALQNSNYGLKCSVVSDSNQKDTYIKEETKKELINSLKFIAENNIEIWTLPELCVDKELLEFLKEQIEKMGAESNLKMVVPGSIYVGVANGKLSNQSPIWIIDNNGKVVEIAAYDKCVPFSMPTVKEIPPSTSYDMAVLYEAANKANCNVITEDLSVSDNGVNFRIVRFDKGYIGIAICRDVLDLSEPCNPLNKYCDFVDIMLVVSMNTGHTNCFTSTAESMARWHNCATIYNNNLTSVGKNDNIVEVTFSLYPDTKKVAGIKGELYYRNDPQKPKPNILTSMPFESLSAIYSGSVKPLVLGVSEFDVLFKIKIQ